MKLILVGIFSFFFCVPSTPAVARTINTDLKKQIADDDDRRLPQGQDYSLAIDGFAFMNPPTDYYHSGTWIGSFLELRHVPQMTLNLKLAATNPSVSYGTDSGAQLQAFIGITGKHDIGPVKIHIQAGDLDRQTIGAGLTFDELEMGGAIFDMSYETFKLRVMKHGTGGYTYCGDIDYVEIGALNGLFAAYTMQTSGSDRCKGPSYDETVIGKDFIGAYSRHEWSYFSYAIEGAQRNDANSGMIKVNSNVPLRSWGDLDLTLQARRYQKGFAAGYIGKIYRDFESIEQIDKSFTNTQNIFIEGDNVHVHSGRADLFLLPENLVRISSRNEFGAFDFEEGRFRRFYLFHHATSYCPNRGRDDCLSLGYANIVLRHRDFAAMSSNAGREPFYYSDRHWRVEAKFRL
jgi:hypothetical protein